MRYLLLIIILVSCLRIALYGQTDSIERVDQIANHIDADSTLNLKVFDAADIYEKSFDGGGIIEIYSDQSGIKKVRKEIGVSYGRLTTIIYFDKGAPVKIIDREENFKWKEDDTGWEYTELNQVFRADIYIFDWNADSNKTIFQGKRNLSEGTCAILEYEPLIKLAGELMK